MVVAAFNMEELKAAEPQGCGGVDEGHVWMEKRGSCSGGRAGGGLGHWGIGHAGG